MATASLKAPGPGFRLLTFSDGSSVWMPPGATEAHYADATRTAEAQLQRQYQAQAARENRPITTPGKVYSATGTYNNDVHGHITAWIDHNLGGNVLNRSAAGRVIASAQPAVGALNRAAVSSIEAVPAVRAYDLTATGANIAKHVASRAAPSIANAPDIPTVQGTLRSVAGTPELPANAPDIQRIAENVASMSVDPSQLTKAPLTSLARNAAINTTGYYGGKVGEAVAGEPGQFFGSFVGGSGPDALKNLGALAWYKYFHGKQNEGGAPSSTGAPTSAILQAGRDLGVSPTFGMVADPEGRRVEKFFKAVPLFGRPIAKAETAANLGIRDAQIGVANEIAGGSLPGQHKVGGYTTTAVTPATIGGEIVRGARQGAANLANKATDEQQQLMTDIGPSSPGNVVHTILRSAAGYPQKFSMDPGNYPSYEARLNNMRTMAIQQLTPEFQKIWGSVPAGTVPYKRLMEYRSRLGNELEGASGLDKGQKDQLYEAVSDAMRNAALQKGGQSLVDQFEAANENYKNTMGKTGTVPNLEKIGGKPEGGYDQFRGAGGVTGPTAAGTFAGGKDEGSAFNYLTSNLNSPSDLALLSNPSVVPNEFWRRAAGQYYSQLGETGENTFRPEKMATGWRGIDPEVQNQLFTQRSGGPNSPAIETANDAALLGENTVLPVERAGLTNVAGAAVLGSKAMDWLSALGKGAGFLGGAATAGAPYWIAKAIESRPSVQTAAIGPARSLADAIYSGVPAAAQNVMQYQNNLYPPSF